MGDEGVLFHTLQQQLKAKENENLNLKMEVAHLRERLESIVGDGNETLELENFELKKNFNDLNESLQVMQSSQHQMEKKYKKAMENMYKLDLAWKDSRKEVEFLTNDLKAQHEKCKLVQNEQSKIETSNALLKKELGMKEAKIQDDQSTLIQGTATIQDLRLQTEELTQQLRQTQEIHYESTRHSKAEHDLEKKYHEAIQEAAGLRGQVKGLETELATLREQLQSSNKGSDSDKSRLIQLMEETSRLKVNLRSAQQSQSRLEQEVSHSEKEIERLLRELEQSRDDTLVQEAKTLKLQEQEMKLSLRLKEYQMKEEKIHKYQEKMEILKLDMKQLKQENQKYRHDYEKAKSVVQRMNKRGGGLKPQPVNGKENNDPTSPKKRSKLIHVKSKYLN